MAGIVNGLPNEDSIRLGNNIRLLREYEKESREQLGFTIHVSGSLIAQYENGTRNVNNSVLSAIAKHYKVSLSGLRDDTITTNMLDKRNASFDVHRFDDLIFSLVPFISDIEADRRENFDKGIEELSYSVKSDGTIIERRFNKACDCFYKSFKEDGVIEGAQNTIFMILSGYGNLRSNKELVEKFMDGSVTNAEMDIASDIIYEEITPEQKQYILKFDDMYNECVCAIKKSKKYSELADLDLAAKYYLSFIDNEKLPAANQEFGMMLLWDLANGFNNKYAKVAINKIFEFFGEEIRI